MSSLVVGGVAIKVAVSSPRWTRMDAVDRARAFDNTFRASQTGGAVRTWDFETPPVLAATEGETYKAALSTVASQLCSGDIIAIPLMCSAELTDGVPTSVAGDPYVVLSFSLHEVQPAKVLLRYSPGDTITGESFSRSTTATYHNSAGAVAAAAINVKRDAHYIGGIRTLLLEDARTNLILRSQEIDHAAWTKTDTTVLAGYDAPDGTVTAEHFYPTTTGATRTVYQGVTVGASTHTASIYAKANGFRWLYLIKPDGSAAGAWFDLQNGVVGTVAASHTATITPLANGWYRCTIAGAANVTALLQVGLADADNSTTATTNGTNGFFVWGGQLEASANEASAYIPTTTATVSRGADSLSSPFTTPPQEMTVYVKFVERGTALLPGYRLWQISNAANALPRLMAYAPSGEFSSYHANATTAVESALATGPSLGQTVEIVTRPFGDGSVDSTQSINGGTATTGAQTAANAFAPAWSGPLLWFNSGGTAASTTGLIAIQSFKIVAGARSLTELRAL